MKVLVFFLTFHDVGQQVSSITRSLWPIKVVSFLRIKYRIFLLFQKSSSLTCKPNWRETTITIVLVYSKWVHRNICSLSSVNVIVCALTVTELVIEHATPVIRYWGVNFSMIFFFYTADHFHQIRYGTFFLSQQKFISGITVIFAPTNRQSKLTWQHGQSKQDQQHFLLMLGRLCHFLYLIW